MAKRSPVLRNVVIVLAVIGLIAVVGLIGMWVMHGSMVVWMRLREPT